MKGDKLPRGTRAVLAEYHRTWLIGREPNATHEQVATWYRAAHALQALAAVAAKREPSAPNRKQCAGCGARLSDSATRRPR